MTTVTTAGRMRRSARLAVAGVLAVGGLAGGWLAAAPANAAVQDPSCSGGSCTVTFTTSGTGQSFTVPTGASSLSVTLYGGTGGIGDDPDAHGGDGAEVSATLTVTAGQSLGVDVGGAGGNGGTVNGGTNGGGSAPGAGGGGGATDVTTSAGTRLLVAGGGGGAGSASPDVYTCSSMSLGVNSGAGGNADHAGDPGGSEKDGSLTLDGGGGGGAGTVTTPGQGGTAGGYTGSSPCGASLAAGTAGNAGQGRDGGNADAANEGGGGGGGGYTGGGSGGSGAVEGSDLSLVDLVAPSGGGGGGSSYLGGSGVSNAAVDDTGNSGQVNDGNGEAVFGYADPVATGTPAYTTPPGQTLTVPADIGLLASTAGTTAPPNDTLTASGPTTTTAGGTVSVATDGSFSYTPPAGFTGSDGFSYTITDASGDYATGTATIDVAVLAQSVAFSTAAPRNAAYGGSYEPAASATSGLPVDVSIDPAATAGACALGGTTVDFTGTGTCVLDATQSGNAQYAPAQAQQSFTIAPAATSTVVKVTASALTATVIAQPPGGGTPTGTVTFAVGGKTVGTEPLNGSGTASVAYASSGAEAVSAAYGGTTDYLASSASTATANPVIVATLSSRYPESKYGWYPSPVIVSFTCAPGSAPLTGPCPGPVTLSGNGADQRVTETIQDTDGGIASVSVVVSIDQGKPAVAVTGIKNKASYGAPGPAKIACHAAEHLSGLAAPCKLTVKRTATAITWTATATSRAGVTATVLGRASLADFYIAGAPLRHGRYLVTLHHTYTVVAYLPGASKAPRYVYATPAGVRPHAVGPAMHKIGPHLWAIRADFATRMNRRYENWSLGVLSGRTLHIVLITLQR
jgi:hypothetical protein